VREKRPKGQSRFVTAHKLVGFCTFQISVFFVRRDALPNLTKTFFARGVWPNLQA